MNVILEQSGEALVATPVEECLDASNTKELRAQLETRLPAGGNVVLDLGRVHFIDSSGLGVILACLRQLDATGGHLRLCNVRKEVKATLELVRLHRLVDIHTTRDEAIEAACAVTFGNHGK